MNKLTAQIAAAYIGSQIRSVSGIEGVLCGVFANHGTCNIELSDGSISVGHLLSSCQPLLTPLSKITDEHAIEVAKIAIGTMAKDPIVKREGRTKISMDYGISRTTCIISPPAKNHEYGREYFYIYNEQESGTHHVSAFGTSYITDKLREWGYDVGHGSIPSLIESHIAIDKTI
jgi:hypothetical protein